MKRKAFDAVAVMREAREKLATEWTDRPRQEQIDSLRKKYAALVKRKSRARR